MTIISPEKPFNSKGFKNLNGQECFANALLQCLFHLEKFKAALDGIHSENILIKLSDLFLAMDQIESTEGLIDEKKASFLQEIQDNYHEVRD